MTQHHQTYEKLSAFLPETLSYLQAYTPSLSVADETMYRYSILEAENIKYFLDREEAEKAHWRAITEQEYRLEQSAQEARKFRYLAANDRKSLIREFRTSFVFHKHTAKSIRRDLRLSLQEVRDDYTQLRAMQDYGIQEHSDTTNTLYTVEYVDLQALGTGTEQYHTNTFVDMETCQEYLTTLTDTFQKTEEQYQIIFGYDTLEEAVQHEYYLQVMLKSYSIYEICTLYREHFAHINAHSMIQNIVLKNPTWNVAGAREVFEHTVQAIYARRGIALQRNIMRKIFARPEVLQNIATLPFEWILSTFEDGMLQYDVIDVS